MTEASTSIIRPESQPCVGVIGGGQLAQMMAEAARSLDVDLVIQTPNNSDPAVSFATKSFIGEITDAGVTAALAKYCDVITFENEFVDLSVLQPLAQKGVCFRPPLQTLAVLLDKYEQLFHLQQWGLPTPAFQAIDSVTELLRPNVHQQFPLVLKSRRHGYDGQGTWVIPDQKALESIQDKLSNTPLLLQAFVPFERELAVIGVRSVSGEVAIYPVVETHQIDQVCRWVVAPADLPPALTEEIEKIARIFLQHSEAVGLFAIELFLTTDQRILINEVAPRTHNSGHFSLDACHTSQFEQHLRAVCGLPLGNPSLKIPGAVMVNLLGYEYAKDEYSTQRARLSTIPGAVVHWYGKSESRPGRKLGHVTVQLQASNSQARQSEARVAIQQVEAIWYQY
ncbi:MAG: 5-(carboxyamino)imidazole ribonucleotide synthase [Microcoleaceae cyanobacterium]